MGQKSRSGDREKPRQPSATPATAAHLGEAIKSRADAPDGALACGPRAPPDPAEGFDGGMGWLSGRVGAGNGVLARPSGLTMLGRTAAFGLVLVGSVLLIAILIIAIAAT